MPSPRADSLPIYADWKAPGEDGQVLIWPDPAELIRQTRENQQTLSGADTVRVQNVPLPQLRRSARELVGHDDPERTLLATGHQSELYHPGVWAKDVLIDRAAAKLGGRAVHFAVDTDSPKHLNLRWPGQSLPVTDDPKFSTVAWSGLLAAAPSPEHVDHIQAVAKRDWAAIGYEPLLFAFFDAMERRIASGLQPLLNASSLITESQSELDAQLGLNRTSILVSPLLRSDAFLAFAHHILARADEFAAAYNRALAEYRTQTGTTNPMRPMPDLFVHQLSIESPFWLDDLASGTRTRPSVFRNADGRWMLELVTGESFVFDVHLDAFEAAKRLCDFLDRTSHRLSPRALTLTLFLRLLVADQFVHGIGGGRYDQVADRIIANHFGLTAPPRFCVTTATLYFPTAVDQQRVCLPCLLQEGHRLKHAALGERKRELVSRIASLPRRSTDRANAFLEMQKERRAAVEASSAVRKWEQGLHDSVAREQEEQVLFDRELFYAVQSRRRLEMVITKYDEAFG